MAWAPDYVTDDDLREYATNSDVEVPADEAQLPRAIAASSRAIDRETRRQFGKTDAAEARVYTAQWSRSKGAWVVSVDDFMTTAGLVVKLDTAGDGTYATTVPATDYVKRPSNAAAKGEPWTEILFRPTAAQMPCAALDEIEVTVPWGWSSVPLAVEQACLLQASRFFVRRNAPFGIAGSPSEGSEMRLLAKVDPDVAVSLRPYQRKARPR